MHKYHVSCRVRRDDFDTPINEHADLTIEAGTPLIVLAAWLAGDTMKEKGWLRCSPQELSRLLQMRKDGSIEDCFETNGVNGSFDWETAELDYDEAGDEVTMCGTAHFSEYSWEVVIKRYQPDVTHAAGCKPPVKAVTDLSRAELEEIVSYAQSFLFISTIHDDGSGDDPIEGWWPHVDVSGADFIGHMTGILLTHGLVPESIEDDNLTSYLKSDGHWVPEEPK